MKILASIRKRLGLKLFFSYLAVILVLIVVLVISVEITTPMAFQNHMGVMAQQGMMNGMGTRMQGSSGNMMSALFTSFRSGVNEAMVTAAVAAFLAALGASIYISRKVVSPVKKMMVASQFIADGHYQHRVELGNRPQDGDELTQLGISFNQMAEKLDQTETMRRQLIGDVSHELRTPLTAIKGSLEGLIDGVIPATPETYQGIVRETDRLQRLVAGLQELSRVEARVVPLQFELNGVIPIIEKVVERLSPQFRDKEIQLEVELPSEFPKALVDEDGLSQILVNLLGNALQYTPPGGRVHVSGKADEKEIMLGIYDTGLGLQSEELNLIFTRFYRVDKSRSRANGGSGIGLTITKHLVELHGGKIRAESEGLGSGSVFYFTLPIHDVCS